MNPPTLTNPVSSEVLTLPHPSDWTIKNLEFSAEKRSIKGDNYIDNYGRNLEFVLDYNAYSNSDYDNLIDFYNDYFANGTHLVFNYAKFPQANNVNVSMHISDRGHALGSGSSLYYSKVTITLKVLTASI